MRVVEILLPKGTPDRSLSPQVVRKIDALQKRMDGYVDKIMNSKTSQAGREFLKSRLRDDYYELKDTIPGFHAVAENDLIPASIPIENTQYEVYDRKTGQRVGGPYQTAKRARGVRDKKDLEYGAVRFGVRLVGGVSLSEAVTKLPLSHDDFALVKKVMEKPIPAVIAPIYIQEIIEDDELIDQIASLEESDPGRDVRPLIAEWFKRVMPDQMYRFNGDKPDMAQKNGVLSPIHGYDSKMYKGTNDPLTGDAYGYY